MPREKPFRDLKTAPMDGSTVEVRHGKNQEIVRAYWAGQNQAFVDETDPHRKTLHRVTGWRPIAKVKAPAS